MAVVDNDLEKEEEQELLKMEKRKNEIMGILMIALGFLSALSLFTSTAGIVGSKLSHIYHLIIGEGSFLIPILFISWGITLIRLKGLRINSKLVGFIMTYITLMAIVHTYSYSNFILDYALKGEGGGFLGGVISWSLQELFGYIGTYIVLFAFLLIGVLLWSDILLLSILKKIKDKIQAIFSNEKNDREDMLEEDIYSEYPAIETAVSELEDKIVEVDIEEIDDLVGDTVNQEKQISDDDNILENNTLDNSKQENFHYTLPNINILKESKKSRKKPINKSKLLEDTLASFGVKAKVIKVNHGPTITKYEIQPASGVKVSKIVNLADDIALALAAPGVRIEAPIPGKAAVGIEVPHLQNVTVRIKDIINSKEFKQSRSKLPLALGVGIEGKPIIADLAQMPHLLVAGATGSGKSVCINTIIASILYKATPGEVKLLLVDPKKVELGAYQGMPHLFAPVVTDPKNAANVLKLVVNEMENRYELFSSSRTRGIKSYNKKVSKEEFLPYIVVIIDELSDLMMVAAAEVEDNICRLAQMARAAGIHLVIATQRPSVDVITGLIKANIPSRIAFAVSSQTDSRTILDMGGAEKLLGKGDMLISCSGMSKPRRVQGAFIDNDEINMLVDFVKNQADPNYEVDLNKINKVELELDNERDELYKEAIKLVVKYQASISMLQRRLHIGHSRAARLIDLMEEDNIVGPYVGSKAREVLISEEELDDFFNGNKED